MNDSVEANVAREMSYIVDEAREVFGHRITRIESFEDAGLLTRDEGFRVYLEGGASIDVTIQVRGMSEDEEETEEEDEE